METKLKNQAFQKYLVFFAGLLTLKVNIKLSKAIKVNRFFFMLHKLQSAAQDHTFCGIYIAKIVAIATQSSMFIKFVARQPK